MAKATATIREALCYQPQHAEVFAANQALFNRVVAFYFECIQAHEGLLALTNKEALTALERLTHATEANPAPIMPLTDIAPDIPAMFRRAAINAALGSARSFFSSLKKWRARKEKHELKKPRKSKKSKPFRERPPVPPRRWNKSVPFYASQWKERCDHCILRHRSGPGRVGPGSRLVCSHAISPKVSRWGALPWFAGESSGGCILPSKRPSLLPPTLSSRSRPIHRPASVRSISISTST
jgi:hypothetical protein